MPWCNSQRTPLSARQADEMLARGDLSGPLHGVPFTVKDWLETMGVVCMAGDERHRHHVPEHDATVVLRLRQAGGIFLGKTNVIVITPSMGAPTMGTGSRPFMT
jgi:amidase